jgi:hypothetical protein
VIQSCRLTGYPHIFHIPNRTPATFYCKTPHAVHSAVSRHKTLQAQLRSLSVHLTTPGQLSATSTTCTWCDTLQNQEPLKMTATYLLESSGRFHTDTLTPLPAGFEVLTPVSLYGLRDGGRPSCWLFLVPLCPEVEIT